MSQTPSVASGPASPKLDRRQRISLAVLLTASFTLAVDFSILNVALPDIGLDLDISLHSLQWVITAFALSAAGFTLLFGRVADLFGRRRLFLGGIALLGVSSLVGGLAESSGLLIAARVAQGLATAAVTPAALSLLTTSYAEGPLRDRVLGLNGALMAAGFTSGAILGGVLTDVLSWRWAFFINVAVAAIVLAVGPAVLKESRHTDRPKMDVAGALSVTAALLAVVYGLSRAGQSSFADGQAIRSLVAAVVFLALFYAAERRAVQPIVPLHILNRSTVKWGNLAGVLAFATETSVVFLLTLYLQKVLGYSPLQAGMAFAVLGAGTVVGGLLGPKMIAAIGTRGALISGFLLQATATLPLALLGTQEEWLILLLAATFVGGVANLVAIVSFMVTATSHLPDNEQGLATGLATMSQQVGITLGTPIMSAIAAAQLHGAGVQPASAVLHGLSVALTANALVCLAAAGLVALSLPARTLAAVRA